MSVQFGRSGLGNHSNLARECYRSFEVKTSSCRKMGGRRGLRRESPQTPFNSGLRIILYNIYIVMFPEVSQIFRLDFAKNERFESCI